MFNLRFLMSRIAIGVLCAVSQVAHANLITNGSFESGTFAPQSNDTMSLDVGATNINGWTVVSHVTAWIGPSNPWFVKASTGNFFLDFTDYRVGAPFGGVSQTISTTPGQAYQLSFDLGSSNLYGRPAAVLASVGSRSAVFTSALVGTNSDWESFVFPFTAIAATTNISLTGVAGQTYIGLDNVKVSATAPVPEPATFSMMLAALPLLGLATWLKIMSRPNPTLNRTRRGRPAWPVRRYTVHFRRPGQSVLPCRAG